MATFRSLCVFPESVPAFCASHKLGWSFVTAAGLHLPDEHQVVSAFGAFDFDCWQCLNLLVLFAYYGYSWFSLPMNNLSSPQRFCFFRRFLGVTALGASQHYYGLITDFCFGRCKKATTSWAELHAKIAFFLSSISFSKNELTWYKAFPRSGTSWTGD